jgi:hypothetical protein
VRGDVRRSYALDAIEVRETEAVPTEKAARAFLDEVARGRTETFPAVGLGEDIRISGDGITGAALVSGDHIVHLCAFRTDDEGSGGRGSRIMRASLRRR